MNIKNQFTKYVSQNIFGMLGVSCYIIADTYFISKAAGSDGITVLNLCLPLYSLIFAIGSMIGTGSAIRFSIARAKKEGNADRYFSNAVMFAVLFGLLFVAVGALCPDKILAVMGGDEGIVQLGIPYARTFLFFGPFFILNYVIAAFVRNDNAPTLAMIGTICSSLFNVVFDYIFMFPMGMGLFGAALATAVSPIVSICICGIHFLSKKNTLKFPLLIPDLPMLVRSCQVGTAAFIGELSSGIATMVFNFLILDLTGNVGIAAFGVIANLAIVANAIFNGVSMGAQPLISDSYGRGEKQELGKLLRLSLATAFAFAVLIYGLVWCFTDTLIAMFNSEGDQVLAELAFAGLRIYFVGFFFSGINTVLGGYFSSTADSVLAGITALSRGIFAIVICAYILAMLFGMNGIWSAFPAAEAVTLVIVLVVYLLKRNRTINLQ